MSNLNIIEFLKLTHLNGINANTRASVIIQDLSRQELQNISYHLKDSNEANQQFFEKFINQNIELEESLNRLEKFQRERQKAIELKEYYKRRTYEIKEILDKYDTVKSKEVKGYFLFQYFNGFINFLRLAKHNLPEFSDKEYISAQLKRIDLLMDSDLLESYLKSEIPFLQKDVKTLDDIYQNLNSSKQEKLKIKNLIAEVVSDKDQEKYNNLVTLTVVSLALLITFSFFIPAYFETGLLIWLIVFILLVFIGFIYARKQKINNKRKLKEIHDKNIIIEKENRETLQKFNTSKSTQIELLTREKTNLKSKIHLEIDKISIKYAEITMLTGKDFKTELYESVIKTESDLQEMLDIMV